MESNRMNHFLARAIILCGFAVYIIYLVRSGHISYYIAPNMEIYVKASAVGLYVIAAYQGYSAYRIFRGQQIDCDCHHEPSNSLILRGTIYGLFLFPLMLGFILPDTSVGSAMAAKKGMNLTGSANIVKAAYSSSGVSYNPAIVHNTETESLTKEDEQIKEELKLDKYSNDFANFAIQLYKKEKIKVKDKGFVEVLSTLEMFKDSFVGKQIEINSGFVYREQAMPQNMFSISRFEIQCCSADALPFGVLVQFDHAEKFAKDNWIKVTGTISKTTYKGNEVIMIKASKVDKISAPAHEYVQVQGNYAFINEL
ncbi:TIGR03943 family protein [Paenibacillus sp. GP183]|uniref:TIGR03943 family putative permease subunit n=1 Tax=Paenibacillus sp. GP183 TaxID=1882751 RepID=UPI00089A2C81|nr:TIGR03943 family protein [Paenibacillus sp. GP183]SED08982.1 TIGR03943 family protein [Paenibacillus sp. GP183]